LELRLSAKKRKDCQQNSENNDPVPDPASLTLLAVQTRNLLAFHQEIGLDCYPDRPGLSTVFQTTGKVSSSPVLPPKKQELSPKPASVSGAISVRDALQELYQKIDDCRICAPDGQTVLSSRPGRGPETPRLFVVGDFCSESGEDHPTLWGQEEDALFWKMMAAIGLDPDSVYVTNCVKCTCPDRDVRKARDRCTDFLLQELAAVAPPLICTMGDMAANVLLSSRQPLVRLRGRFHEYHFPHGGTARLMPTFHPRFLLEHPEMKKAAWLDLQAIQRLIERR
jgi:DNA polymerase